MNADGSNQRPMFPNGALDGLTLNYAGVDERMLRLTICAKSVEADVYFCPERQGTYFGSFYLKDAPAMGNPNYTIPSNLTGDMGCTFLETLTPDQAGLVTNLVDTQRPYLQEIVETRREVSTGLRQFMTGESVERDAVLSLMEEYGELDGAIVYNFAVNFAQVNQTLTAEQQVALMALRTDLLLYLSTEKIKTAG
jgi:hypothetical protein